MIKANTSFLSYLTILLLIFLSSHPIHGLLGLDVKFFFIIVLLVLSFIVINFRSFIDNRILLWASFIIFLSLIGSIVSYSLFHLTIGLTGAIMFFLAYQTVDFIFKKNIINFLYIFLIIILILSWTSFFYASAGFAPTFITKNLETNKNLFFYFSSFTNSVEFNFIRPSGLFDEPGSLVLFSTVIICFLSTNNYSNNKILMILFLLLITGSLTALIIFIVFFLIHHLTSKKIILSFLIIFLFFFFLKFFSIELFEYLISRVTNKNEILNNNRLLQVYAFFENIDMETFFKGSLFTSNINTRIDQSSNPFTLIWESGCFIWLPYFLIEIWLFKILVLGKKNNKFSAFAIFLTLLQRPYIFSLYWGILLIYPIVWLYKNEKDKKIK